jgi:hypothetical protein
MKPLLVVVILLAVGGCASPGTSEDFKWSIECPKTVDKGAEFVFTVRALNAADQPVEGVKYKYQILWTAGSSSPLRHKGRSGEGNKVHARLSAGPATIVVTCENREGLESKVLETTFEVR